MTLLTTTNLIFSILTVIGQILAILLIAFLLAPHTFNQRVSRIVNRKIISLTFTVALIATLGSLFYSEVIGFEPCKLCWYQRILMYPQVVILGLSLKKESLFPTKQIFLLSIIGACLSIYHYLSQLGLTASLSCSTLGYSSTCSQRFVLEFGYITIPLMALTAFLLITLSSLIIKRVATSN